MTASCEIFYVKHGAKLRWKWRSSAATGAVEVSKDGYELFYDCLSAARGRGYTPTFDGMRMFQPGDPSGFSATRLVVVR